jgi:hypothetical protein
LGLLGTSIAALLVGFGGTVIAQDDEAGGMTAQALNGMLAEAWTGNDTAMLEQLYAPEAAHKAVYFDGIHESVGRDAIIDEATGPATITPLGPVMELDVPEGQLHWVNVADVVGPGFPGMGTVCNFWAQDGQIVRHDCLLSMDCPVGYCMP